MALLVLLMLAGCSKVPDGLLSEREMQRVMKDMLLAEAMIGTDYKTYEENESKEALYQSVFRKHGITQAKYDSSLVWYGRNLDIYMKVYERVLKDLDKEQADLGDVQADAAPVSNNDSVDVWPRRTFLSFYSGALFNGVTFDIKPETGYSSGSTFVLGMDVWGLNRKMRHHPEIRLCADQGDTTVFVNDKVMRDGRHETVLKTLSTKKVKRVYGFIRLDGAGSRTYHKIYIDGLNLVKYKYGSEILEEKKDSIP